MGGKGPRMGGCPGGADQDSCSLLVTSALTLRSACVSSHRALGSLRALSKSEGSLPESCTALVC